MYIYKGTGNLSLCMPLSHVGDGGKAPLILSFGTRVGWLLSSTPQPLYTHGKSPLKRRLGRPQCQAGNTSVTINFSLPGFEPQFLWHLTCSLDTTLSTQSQLLHVYKYTHKNWKIQIKTMDEAYDLALFGVTNHLILFRKIISVSCEQHTKHIHSLCVQKTVSLNVKAGGTYTY
jgi:hypothetical protein